MINRFSRFLLPRLHLDRLARQTSIRNLREALESLPTKLDETYSDAMARIQGQVEEHSKLALSALSWISNTLRPLQLDELQHALAIRRGDQSLDEEALEDETLIISVSAGLVILDAQSGTIRLVHFTVEEYLRDRKQELFPNADSQIAETCLTYLSFDIFQDGRCSSDQELEVRLRENCFLHYAAHNWGDHAHSAEGHTVEDLALGFLRNVLKVACSSEIMLTPDYRLEYGKEGTIEEVSGLHLTAWFGLSSITKRLLEGETVADSKDGYGQTPLSRAAERGHETIVELLRDRSDVNANSQDYDRQTPLSYGARAGHETVVRLLMERDDVEADSQSVYKRTPLSYAAEAGHEKVVKLLMERDKVNADSPDRDMKTPLVYAAAEGHEKVVKLLIDRHDVVADSRDLFGRTPLSYAAEAGHEILVKLLVDRHDVVTDSRDRAGRTPLSYAAEAGHEMVVKLLMDRHDVVVDSRDRWGDTPLSWAIQNGHATVQKLLEDRLKNINAEEQYRTIQ